jgi:2-polyprenyl-3-methyl-5-hydroxy-6-metoxy-1,4-benzoquinol methylase
MAEGIDGELTRRYLGRAVDGRMVAVIDRELDGTGSVLDVGCGSGLYGPYLRRRAATVIGIDHDQVLCEHAAATGAYDRVICDRVERLLDHVAAVDVVFCSELLEHLRNRELPAVLEVLETVAGRELIITVPNRLSPHAHMDPTHVLQSRRFTYTLHPLGFADAYRRRLWCRPLDAVARRVALLSPTVLYLGRRQP